MATAGNPRDYDRVADAVQTTGSHQERMQAVVDAIWEHLSATGISWVGFYLKLPKADELVLGPCRNKPACSPIGLHGACGQAFTRQEALVVRDVAELGEGYIACDPRDRSEVVVPIFHERGSVIGVLDLDSHDVASFDEADVAGLRKVLRSADLPVS